MKKSLVMVAALMLCFLLSQPVSAALPVEEYGLNPDGGAYEINADGHGGLWVSDFGATPGEIVKVEAASGAQTVYPISWGDPQFPTDGRPSDARMVGGSIWWVDVVEGVIGRASVSDGSFSLWSVESLTGPDGASLYSLAVDGLGQVWASDTGNPWIFQLTLDAQNKGTVCKYTLGDSQINVFNFYITYSDGYLWVGDNFSKRILRLDVADGTYTAWNLPTDATLFALAIDEQGVVWATDYSLPIAYKFEPTLNRLSSYPLPPEIVPMMISLEGSRVIFSAINPASIAILDPTNAISNATDLTIGGGTFNPTCGGPVDPIVGTAAPVSRPAPKTELEYPFHTKTTGWDVYEVPSTITCNSKYPWGIANEAGNIWMVDNYCSQLIRFSLPPSFVYLPLVLR